MPEELAPPQTYRDLAGLQLSSNSPVRLPRSAQQNILGPTHPSRRKRARVGQTFELFAQLRIQNQHRFRPSHRHRHVHCARGDAYIPSSTNASYLWDITAVPTCPDSALGRSRPTADAKRVFLYFFSNGYHVTSIPVFTISWVRRAYSVNGASTYTVATHALLFPNARLTPPFNIGAN
jgi:hypothetical protein